jgi:flavin reductase (DIM6/NTAB) family NADH-FMN oxidoreductase RutF
MSIDPDEFRSILGRFASGVTIVTAIDDRGRDHGLTVSAFASLSLVPPLVLVCVDRTASLYPALVAAKYFAVNILAADQEALARRFSALEGDRFDGIGYTRGSTGVAVLDEVLAYIECRMVRTLEGGDHTIFVAEVEAGHVNSKAPPPLLYYRGGYAQFER